MLCIVTFYLPLGPSDLWFCFLLFLCSYWNYALTECECKEKHGERGKSKDKDTSQEVFQLPVHEVTKKTLSNVLAERMENKD